jgi:hypothetical protein
MKSLTDFLDIELELKNEEEDEDDEDGDYKCKIIESSSYGGIKLLTDD